MSQEYRKASITRHGFDFDSRVLMPGEVFLTLSHTGVLGVVQSAFDALDADDPALLAVKARVMQEVAEGRLADALRSANIGAGAKR